jgi:photosystem II stability/assembly factor-like uncharacterized protein
MTEGRIVIGGEPRGAAFLIGPNLAITARHVITAALDSNGNPQQGFEFILELRDGSQHAATLEACDSILDVASVRLTEPSMEWLRIGVPAQDATWAVTTRFLATDPVISGTIIDPARPIRNNTGHETVLIQLHVEQSLGSYKGYSGSPVCVRAVGPGSSRNRVVVGVLVEQGLWRTKKQPGQNQITVANVLWAAPFPAVLDALGLTGEVRPYGDWTLISPEWAFFMALQVDPVEPLTVYAGLANGEGMYRSHDGGRHWEPMNAGMGTRIVRSIAASAFDPSLYAATDNGLWVSNDRGATWREDPGFRGKSLFNVALSLHDPELLLVGCQHPGGTSSSSVQSFAVGSSLMAQEGLKDSGLKFSRDGGRTWFTFQFPDNINGLWVDPEDSRVFAVASTEDGVFFSRDGLEKLRRVEAFPKDQKPLCFALVPGDPDQLLVGTLQGGLYWSDDDGVSWERGTGIPDVQVSDLKFLAGSPSRVMAATPLGPFESADGGNRWHRSAKGLDYEFSIVLAPLADGSVILGTCGGGAYRRAAGRTTWNPSNRGFPSAVMLRLEQTGGWLYAGTVGLLRSPDGGASWRYSGLAGEQVTAIAVAPEAAKEDPHFPEARGGLLVSKAGFGPPKPAVLRDDLPIDILVGTTRGKLFLSRNSGATWEPLTSPESWCYDDFRSAVLLRGTPRRIGVLVEGKGFFVSNDIGQSWSAEASGALGQLINLIVTSRHDDRRLFALTVDRGVFLSDNGGVTWAKCEGFPPGEVFTAIAEPGDDAGVVFAASVLRSVYRSADGGRTFGQMGHVDLQKDADPSRLVWTTLVVRSRPKPPVTLVLGSSLGAYMSTDDGRTWTPLAAGILRNDYHVNDLLISNRGTRILMATNKGLFAQELIP